MRTTTGSAPMASPIGTPLSRSIFIDNAEIQLRTWEQRMSQISAEAKLLAADSKAIIEGRMRDLGAKLSAAHEQLDDIRALANDQWEEAKAAFDHTWDQIAEIFNRTDPPTRAAKREAKH